MCLCIVSAAVAARWEAAPQLFCCEITLLLSDVFETVCCKESGTHTLTHHRQKWILCVILSTFTPVIHYALTWAALWDSVSDASVKFTFCATRLHNRSNCGTLVWISDSFHTPSIKPMSLCLFKASSSTFLTFTLNLSHRVSRDLELHWIALTLTLSSTYVYM